MATLILTFTVWIQLKHVGMGKCTKKNRVYSPWSYSQPSKVKSCHLQDCGSREIAFYLAKFARKTNSMFSLIYETWILHIHTPQTHICICENRMEIWWIGRLAIEGGRTGEDNEEGVNMIKVHDILKWKCHKIHHFAQWIYTNMNIKKR